VRATDKNNLPTNLNKTSNNIYVSDEDKAFNDIDFFILKGEDKDV